MACSLGCWRWIGPGPAVMLVLMFGLVGATRAPQPDKKSARNISTNAWTLLEAADQLALHPRDAYLQYVVLQLWRRHARPEIKDFEAKYYTAMRVGLEHNVTFLGTPNPSTILRLVDEDKLAWMLDQKHVGPIFDAVWRFDFVKTRNGGIALHEGDVFIVRNC